MLKSNDTITGELQPGFLNMPRLPVSGLGIRILAILVDLICIVMFLHLLSRVIPGFFWTLGASSPFVTGFLTFLYFILLNGKLGKGRTLGKMLVGIRVTDYDGNPPTMRQSIIRTVILFPMFVATPLLVLLIGHSRGAYLDYFAFMVKNAPFFALLLANVVSIPFNPFKQGLHDFFATTMVRPGRRVEEPVLAFSEMTERVGHSWIKFHRQPQYSAGIAFLLILALLGFVRYPGRTDPEIFEAMQAAGKVQRIQGFDQIDLTWDLVPEEDSKRAMWLGQPGVPERIITLANDIHTTGTVTVFVYAVQPGRWTFSADDARFRPNVQQFADTFRQSFLKPVMQLQAKRQDSRPPDQPRVAPTDPMDFARALRLPMNLIVVFQSHVSMTPYNFGLTEMHSHLVIPFPPLIDEKIDEPSAVLP